MLEENYLANNPATMGRSIQQTAFFIIKKSKVMKVINNVTGKISYATYGHNTSGNLRIWVEGKFYSDKQFDKTFSQLDPTENYIKIQGQWKIRKK